jgi:hypothetical protein
MSAAIDEEFTVFPKSFLLLYKCKSFVSQDMIRRDLFQIAGYTVYYDFDLVRF